MSGICNGINSDKNGRNKKKNLKRSPNVTCDGKAAWHLKQCKVSSQGS